MVINKDNLDPKESDKKLKDKSTSVSVTDNIETNKSIQELLTRQKELETRNQQLEAAQNELRILKERYSDLFDNAPVGYLILDASLKIQEVNQTACSTFNMKPEELTGQFFKKFVDQEYHKIFSGCLKEFITDNLSSKCDLKLKTRDSDFYGRIIVSAIVAKGNPENYRIAIVDISKEKELEDKLIKESRKTRENERLKTAFMANMSHEIRTPMNGIIGFAELLQDPDLSPGNLQSYINIIQNSGKRMLSIINELVDISKIESGTVRPVIVNTNVDELLNYLYEFFLPDVTKKGLSISINSEELDEMLIIKTDKEKLHAIFINLLKNAINYTEEGHIQFGYSRNDDHLEFYVSDTGIGISPEDQTQIFERFYRSDSSTGGQSDGVGLGLPISKAFVNMLGGNIWVESEPQKGSTFLFTIPLSGTGSEAESANQIANIKDPDDLLSRLTILVAEDDEPARMYLSELLKSRCKAIHFAKNGREAVDIYSDVKPDLVLMDIKMPVMDGYSAAIKIKGMDENAFIIAQTAYALAGDREKALAAGCSEYLAKPVLKEDLLTTIRKHFM